MSAVWRLPWRRNAGLWLAAVLLAVAGWAPLSWGAFDHSLTGYLAYAHEHNPMVAMARKEAQSKALESKAAFSLPGPSLMIESDRRDGGWMVPMLGVAQTFPWPGELRWKQRMALLEYESAEHQVVQAWIEVSFDIREVYGMLYETGKTIESLKESLGLLHQITDITQTAYAVGKASQSALLKLQVEAAGVENRIRSLELKGAQQRFRLSELCATKEVLSAPFPEELPRLSVPSDLDEIRKITRGSNPRVLAREKDAEAALARARMERNAAFPMLRIEGAYSADDGMGAGAWKVGVEAMVPFWPVSASRKAGAARFMAESARARAASEAQILQKDAEVWYMEYQDRARTIALLDSVLIPRASEMVSLMMQEYRVGMIPLSELIDSQRMYLMQKIDRVMEEVAREMAAAEVVVCCLAIF